MDEFLIVGLEAVITTAPFKDELSAYEILQYAMIVVSSWALASK